MPKLSMHVLAGGERVPMLHGVDGLPLFYPTLFATSQLRNAGAAVNTIRNKLADIVVLLRWEGDNGRDLVAQFLEGHWLSLADVVSLRDFAKLDMRELRHVGPKAAAESTVLDLLEARVASSKPQVAVGGQQHFNRLSTIADYVEFLASVLTQGGGSKQFASEIERMVKSIRKHRPRGIAKQQDDNPHERSPPTELVQRFMAVAAEGGSQNPFRDPGIQLRNDVIFRLFLNTGIRRGELLSLRIDQIEFGHEPRLWIRRSQDDIHDSRRYQPVAKTKERVLSIPQALAEQIHRYIMEVRSKIVPARRHPYLIVSHRRDHTWGLPLSASAVNSQIFARMRTVDPAFKSIHPHAFRHHFNYMLSVDIDERNAKAKAGGEGQRETPISEARELDARAYLNGHRSRASGATYNQRHIREASDKAIRQVQARLTGHDKVSQEDNEPS